VSLWGCVAVNYLAWWLVIVVASWLSSCYCGVVLYLLLYCVVHALFHVARLALLCNSRAGYLLAWIEPGTHDASMIVIVGRGVVRYDVAVWLNNMLTQTVDTAILCNLVLYCVRFRFRCMMHGVLYFASTAASTIRAVCLRRVTCTHCYTARARPLWVAPCSVNSATACWRTQLNAIDSIFQPACLQWLARRTCASCRGLVLVSFSAPQRCWVCGCCGSGILCRMSACCRHYTRGRKGYLWFTSILPIARWL
jgi:hypothetical protein